MEILTKGTKYEIDSFSDESTPFLEMEIREIMYSMYLDAHSKYLAIQLRNRKEKHFAELYEFSYGVSIYDAEFKPSSRTERVALLIVDEKAKYEKQIKRLIGKHKRFYAALDLLTQKDREILLNYFERNMIVDYETLRSVFNRNLKKLASFYQYEVKRAEERNKEISDSIEGTMNIIQPKPSEDKRQKRLERLRKKMSGGV